MSKLLDNLIERSTFKAFRLNQRPLSEWKALWGSTVPHSESLYSNFPEFPSRHRVIIPCLQLLLWICSSRSVGDTFLREISTRMAKIANGKNKEALESRLKASLEMLNIFLRLTEFSVKS